MKIKCKRLLQTGYDFHGRHTNQVVHGHVKPYITRKSTCKIFKSRFIWSFKLRFNFIKVYATFWNWLSYGNIKLVITRQHSMSDIKGKCYRAISNHILLDKKLMPESQITYAIAISNHINLLKVCARYTTHILSDQIMPDITWEKSNSDTQIKIYVVVSSEKLLIKIYSRYENQVLSG